MRCMRLGAMVTALLTAAPAPAAWLEARTDHFVVYSESSEAQLHDFAAQLERFDRGMRRLRGLPDIPQDRANPLTIFVVRNVGMVQKLCGGLKGAKSWCDNVAGFYDGRADGSVAFMPRRTEDTGPLALTAQTVLFHEYTHHFMLENFSAAYPAWFVEGFAEFNSTASFDPDGTIGFGKPALHRYYGLMTGKPLSLQQMLAAGNARMTGEQREGMYGRGWLLTHYLTFEPTRKGQLTAYLKAINEGKSSKAAAEAAFGDIGKLDAELDRYLHRTQLSYLRLAADTVPPGPIAIRALDAGETAIMPVRLRSKRGVDAAAAAQVVADARRLAAPYPNAPKVQDALAEAEYDAGNDDPAEAAADRALAADPKDVTALLYKGRVRIRRLARTKSTDAAAWRQARGWFVRANRIAPDAAAPLMLNYEGWIAAHDKPNAAAVKGLEYAFQLAPQDANLRWLLARQDLMDGHMQEARATLAPLAFDPHADANNPAATLVALIDKGDSQAIADALAKGDAG